MVNPRPYLRSAQKIEWDSTFGNILGPSERKSKFSETRRKLDEPEGWAIGRDAPLLPLILFRASLGQLAKATPEGYFRNSGYFSIIFGNYF